MRKLLDLGAWGAVLVMVGCGANVVDPGDDGAGGAGAGTIGVGAGSEGAGDEGGGGGSVGPRSIEVAMEYPSEEELQQTWVLVNDVSGALKRQIPGPELPVQVEVQDGDLITFAAPTAGQTLLESFRVTPGVTRVDHSTVGPGSVVCDVEPMEVTVTIPAVDGAFDYQVHSSALSATSSFEPGSQTFGVRSCAETFDLLAFARVGGTIARYELVRDIPFEPGGATTIDLTLPSTSRTSFTIAMDSLDGVESVQGEADWQKPPAMFPHESGNALHVESPVGTLHYDVSTMDPGPGYGLPRTHIVASYAPDDGWCDDWLALVFGAADAQFSVGELASVRELSDGTLALGAGAKGDYLWRSYSAGDYVWLTHEDPESAPWPFAMIELPPEVAWTDQPLELYSLGNADLGMGGYAATIGQALPIGPFNQTIRVAKHCP